MTDGRYAIYALLFFAVSGCAGITPEKVTKNNDSDLSGFRYYETSPFLFIHSDGKGGVTSDIIYLPDETKKRSIHPYAYLASNDVTLKFTNGALNEASTNVDETVVPNAVLTALTTVASKLFIASPPKGSDGKVPAPYLYKITMGKDGQITLRGGNPTIEIHATITTQGGQ
jgi:hypothetical protein